MKVRCQPDKSKKRITSHQGASCSQETIDGGELQLDSAEPSHMSPRVTDLVSEVESYKCRLVFVSVNSEL